VHVGVSGMVPFERGLVSSYRPSIVITFPLYSCFTDIAAFVRQHAIFPTPPLVSPKFPHVPLGVGGSPFGYKERRYWAMSIVRAICFQDFQPMGLQYTNVTDGQDGRTTCDRKTALCTKVHCAVKSQAKSEVWSTKPEESIQEERKLWH